MVRLAENVQVRKESWGLLFYSQPRHRLSFIRSGNWLEPEHFNGDWSFEALAADIAERIGKPAESVKKPLSTVTEQLIKNGMIVDGLL